MAIEPFFLTVGDGQRFCLLHTVDAGQAVRGALIYIHPFAEEMNKTRRMAALQARAMVAAGYTVLQIDLHGCGDSSGDFGDADWSGWVVDVLAGLAWLRQRSQAPLWVWGLRAGCLLATEAARRNDAVEGLLLWQPVVSGRQHLQQFLRLKSAGEMLAGGSKGVMQALKSELAQGRSVEVAGYRLSAGLAKELEAADLILPERSVHVEWLEVAATPENGLSVVANSRLEQWRELGHSVRGRVVGGPSFWQTSEIEENHALVAATLDALATLPVLGRRDVS